MKMTSSVVRGPAGNGQAGRQVSQKHKKQGETTQYQDGIDGENTFLLQRTLRSGQTIRYPGHVVVMGDVNPGAEIVAGGNIIVMGSLRGVAHAGAGGYEGALVTAFRLNPTQLRIANHFTRSPDGEYPEPQQPEMARIVEGTLVIENYHPGANKVFNL